MTTPWDSISPSTSGAIWKLRSATARYCLYRGRDADGSILFLFEFADDHANILRRLPQVAGIDLDYRRFSNPKRHGLIMKLTDGSYVELFAVLCEDLAATIERLEDERQAVLSFLHRLGRWQQLLASGARRLLKPKEIRGLMGELHILEMLLSESELDPVAIVSAWTGPSGAAQDFQFQGQNIEVKATGEASPRLVRISSEFQLDTTDAPVTLSICHLPLTDDPAIGLSLNQTVARISDSLSRNARQAFDNRLAIARYVDIPDYDTPLFEHTSTDHFEVREGFPSLARNTLPASISGVKYELNITQISEFKTAGLPRVTA